MEALDPRPGRKARPVVPKDMCFLIVSNEPWYGPRYSKHNYALALAERRPVLFLDPVRKWSPWDLLGSHITLRPVEGGITLVRYRNALPALNLFLLKWNNRIISRRLRKVLQRTGHGPLAIWSFDPCRLFAPKDLGVRLSIFHAADDMRWKLPGERMLVERSGMVFSIARDLLDRYAGMNQHLYHVPHGIGNSEFGPAHRDPALAIPDRYALFIGNINDRSDHVLITRLVEEHPEITWVFAGPMNVKEPEGIALFRPGAHANVRYLGTLPYPQLKGLIHDALFGFVLLKEDDGANRLNSHKLLQFLAQGKPVFCSWFSEHTDRQDLLYMRERSSEIPGVLKDWLAEGEDPGMAEKRIAEARRNTFDHILDALPFEF